MHRQHLNITKQMQVWKHTAECLGMSTEMIIGVMIKKELHALPRKFLRLHRLLLSHIQQSQMPAMTSGTFNVFWSG